MFQWSMRIFEKVLVCLMALLFLQAPLFIHEYKQQLTGHVEELSFQVEAMRQAAMESNKTLEEFVHKFVTNPDGDVARQGDVMQNMVERWRFLSDALNALEHATIFTKPMAFLQYFNFAIAKSTWQAFHIGVMLNFEGFCYALVGIFFGTFLYSLFSYWIRRLAKKMKIQTT